MAINRSLEKMEVEAIVKIIANLILVISTYVFIYRSQTVYSLAGGYIVGNFLGLVLSIIIFEKYLKNIFQYFSKKLVRSLLITAWPFAFFAILNSIMGNTDTVMIGWMKDVKEVGFYSTSQRFMSFLYILPGLVASSLLPTLAKNLENKDKIKNVISSSIKMIYLFSIPLLFGGLIVGGDLIVKILGQEYFPVISMFKISLFSILFVFPALILNNIIFLFDKHKSIIKISIIGTILNVAINMILIPKYGGVGASFATLISQIVILFFLKKELKKIVNIKIFSGLLKTIVSSFLMALLLIFFSYLKINLYLSILISMILYFVLLIVQREESISKLKLVIIKK